MSGGAEAGPTVLRWLQDFQGFQRFRDSWCGRDNHQLLAEGLLGEG